MSTGFGGSDARDDFDLARRRRALARAAGTVSGRDRSATHALVPLSEVAAALGGQVSERRLGQATVPADGLSVTGLAALAPIPRPCRRRRPPTGAD